MAVPITIPSRKIVASSMASKLSNESKLSMKNKRRMSLMLYKKSDGKLRQLSQGHPKNRADE